jgi:hypothetical protein
MLIPVLALGCASYDAPPTATLEGLNAGLLSDATLPLVVRFSEPVVRDTLHLKVAPFFTDAEGNLPDEDSDPATEIQPGFQLEPGLEDKGGVSEWVDETTLRIVLDVSPPVGQSQVLLIDAGLRDAQGNETAVRQRIGFGYEFRCAESVGSKIFREGAYFFLVDAEQPLEAQLQLFGLVDLDATTGAFRATFTNADRNRDDRCPTPCKSTEACRLIPAPECVVPSERAGTVEEHSDFVANSEPPAGFSFTVAGCVVDQEDGSVAFATKPTDVVVQAPPVTLKQIELASAFTLDAQDVLRAIGTMKAKDVLLGTSSSGVGLGTLTARSLTPEQTPPNLPIPPPIEDTPPEGDAGP